MTILYCDLENGNDNYAGSSFSLLAQGTNGRISSSTFSSATANFPNDGSLVNHYLSIFNGTIYAVYRITAWVSPTSLTIAIITGGTALANQTVDRQYYIGGRWKTITSGATAVRIAPGDEVRIMGSPAPTQLGVSALWTSGQLQATKSITSSTNGTPISIVCASHGYSTGDTIVITGHSNTDANGTWEITVTGSNSFTLDNSSSAAIGTGGTARLRNNTRVLLSNPVTKTIASTGWDSQLWSALDSANVTTGLNTTIFKEHNRSHSIAIGAGFGTGVAAITWPSSGGSGTDFTGYQQISFWIYQVSGTVAGAGALSLNLSSNFVGGGLPHSLALPGLGALGRWMPVTIDLGVDIGSGINTIGFQVNVDSGAQTFLISNIIACKAPSDPSSLTLHSLLSPQYDTAYNLYSGPYWSIQSISGTRVMLDTFHGQTPASANNRGFCDYHIFMQDQFPNSPIYRTTYKRECIKLLAVSTVSEAGTVDTPIKFSGGWSRSDMATQNLETWIDLQNGASSGVDLAARSWLVVENIAVVRANVGVVVVNSSYSSVSILQIHACSASTFQLNIGTPSGFRLAVGWVTACANGGISTSTGCPKVDVTVTGGIVGNGSDGIQLFGSPFVLKNFTAAAAGIDSLGDYSVSVVANNNGRGILARPSKGYITGFIAVINATTAQQLNVVTGEQVDVYMYGCVFPGASPITISGTSEANIFSQGHDGIESNHKIFTQGGLISTDGVVRRPQSSSGISWKLQPTSTQFVNSRRRLQLSVAKFACPNKVLIVTVKAWMYRDNSALNMSLRLANDLEQYADVPGNFPIQEPGTESMVTLVNQWQQVEISFLHYVGRAVYEIVAEAWGGTTYTGWVDDLTFLQEPL